MNNIAKTLNIYLIAEMQRSAIDKSFDYMIYIEDRKIKIIPNGTETIFTDVYLSNEFVTANNEEEFIKIFGINLTANIELHGTENDDYHVNVDDLGQIVITLDINLEDTNSFGEFIEVVENKEIDLITEEDLAQYIDTAETLEEIPDTSSVEAEVLTEAELSDEEGPEWVITYSLNTKNESLNEDTGSEVSNTAVITAPDIQTAIKYAEQNARVQAKENNNWVDAEVISVKKKAEA